MIEIDWINGFFTGDCNFCLNYYYEAISLTSEIIGIICSFSCVPILWLSFHFAVAFVFSITTFHCRVTREDYWNCSVLYNTIMHNYMHLHMCSFCR